MRGKLVLPAESITTEVHLVRPRLGVPLECWGLRLKPVAKPVAGTSKKYLGLGWLNPIGPWRSPKRLHPATHRGPSDWSVRPVKSTVVQAAVKEADIVILGVPSVTGRQSGSCGYVLCQDPEIYSRKVQ